MAETKVTKREYFERIIEIAEAAGATDIADFARKQIKQLEAKAEKAKERAAKTKAEGDALREAVQAVLTEDYQTIDAITEQVDFEDVTRAKVVARLTQLVKNNIAEKEMVKVEGASKKQTAYKLATVESDEVE